MISRLTIGKQTAIGYALILFLTLAVGATGLFALHYVLQQTDFHESVNRIQAVFGSAREHADEYRLNSFTGGKERQETEQAALSTDIDRTITQIEFLLKDRERDPELAQQLADIRNAIQGYGEFFVHYVQAETMKTELGETLREIHTRMNRTIQEGGFMLEDMVIHSRLLEAAIRAYADRNTDTRLQEMETAISGMNQAVEDWNELVSGSETHRAVGQQITALVLVLRNLTDQYAMLVQRQQEQVRRMQKTGERINGMFGDLIGFSTSRVRSVERIGDRMIIAFTVAGILLGILYAVFSARAIKRRIHNAITGVGRGTVQVVNASDHVSTTSQQIAQDASEQAASVQEVMSALEILNASTEKNDQDVRAVDQSMNEIKSIFTEADDAAAALVVSMDRVLNAGEEIRKILKNIDEIAFQTNLLSLNAAVEAARAGSAGAGFAVVAGEVRNLALRAGQAAEETRQRIDGAVQTISESSALVNRTHEIFRAIGTASEKIDGLVREIAGVSREQGRGVQEIYRAVAEINQITMNNAASAEEFASASEDLTAQARSMENAVEEIARILGRRRANS